MATERIGKTSSALSWLLVGLILGGLLGAGGYWGWNLHRSRAVSERDPSEERATQAPIHYACPMHPSVRSDSPGKCPICNMDLAPVEASGQTESDGEDLRVRLEISRRGLAMAQIETVPVTYRPLEHEINTYGQLTLDERRVTHVHTRISGWLEEVFVTFTGQEVEGGQPLVSIYSEELVRAQEEYLLAARNARGTNASQPSVLAQQSEALLEAARLRLLRWGVTREQIRALEEEGKVSDSLTLQYNPAPGTPRGGVVIERFAADGHFVERGYQLFTIADLSSLWMLADIYEYEMAWIEEGQRVEITTSAYPGRVFEGSIAFIDPLLKTGSRTLQIRVDVDNPARMLRPGMYVNARIRIPFDRTHFVIAELRREALERWDPTRSISRPLLKSHMDHAEHGETIYVCPMHPEITSTDPDATCPLCGMFLEPMHDSHDRAEHGETIYVCPMHPEIISTDPEATCPLCGMFLEPMAPAIDPWEEAPENMVLAIPDLAVLRTGRRELVYVEESPGVYVREEIVTGPPAYVYIDGQSQRYVPVLAGLEPGKKVVTRGNFLLDSQTTLTGAAAAAYGSALDGGNAPGHAQH